MRVLGVSIASCSDWELFNLRLPSSNIDKEGVWMVGNFISNVWENIYIRGGARLKEEQFFGFSKLKYKLGQECEPDLKTIPNLFV